MSGAENVRRWNRAVMRRLTRAVLGPAVLAMLLAARYHPGFVVNQAAVTALARIPGKSGFVLGSQAGVLVQPSHGIASRAVATELENVHGLSFSPDHRALAVAGGTAGERGIVEIWPWPAAGTARQLAGHGDLVYDCAWLPDSERIASASADRSIRIWDVRSGESIATLSGHSAAVLSLAVSPDGRLLCSGSADHTIRVWDTRSWQLLRTLPNHLGPVHALAFRSIALPVNELSGAAYLASAAEDETVRIWQPEIGRMVRIVRHGSAVLALRWTGSGSLLSGSKDGIVRTIDADRGLITDSRPTLGGWIMSLAVDDSSRTAAAGDSLGRLHIVNW